MHQAEDIRELDCSISIHAPTRGATSDLVKIRTQLQELGAIEGFTDSDVTVAQGDSKKAVVITSAITVVNAMGKLYETVTVA